MSQKISLLLDSITKALSHSIQSQKGEERQKTLSPLISQAVDLFTKPNQSIQTKQKILNFLISTIPNYHGFFKSFIPTIFDESIKLSLGNPLAVKCLAYISLSGSLANQTSFIQKYTIALSNEISQFSMNSETKTETIPFPKKQTNIQNILILFQIINEILKCHSVKGQQQASLFAFPVNEIIKIYLQLISIKLLSFSDRTAVYVNFSDFIQLISYDRMNLIKNVEKIVYCLLSVSDITECQIGWLSVCALLAERIGLEFVKRINERICQNCLGILTPKQPNSNELKDAFKKEEGEEKEKEISSITSKKGKNGKKAQMTQKMSIKNANSLEFNECEIISALNCLISINSHSSLSNEIIKQIILNSLSAYTLLSGRGCLFKPTEVVKLKTFDLMESVISHSSPDQSPQIYCLVIKTLTLTAKWDLNVTVRLAALKKLKEIDLLINPRKATRLAEKVNIRSNVELSSSLAVNGEATDEITVEVGEEEEESKDNEEGNVREVIDNEENTFVEKKRKIENSHSHSESEKEKEKENGSENEMFDFQIIDAEPDE